jgi:hypothetical protein
MSPQKQSAATRLGGPPASRENRERPQESKPRNEPSQRQVRSGNAQRREQAKHTNPDNIEQQGNRANVRQNTTGQGNRRSA